MIDRQEAGSSADLGAILRECQVAETHLDEIFARVAEFQNLTKTLDEKSTRLLQLSNKVHFISLNAIIASHQLG